MRGGGGPDHACEAGPQRSSRRPRRVPMRVGVPAGYGAVEDCLKEAEMMVFWSCDPESTNGAYAGFMEQHTGRIRLFGQSAESLFVAYVDQLVERLNPGAPAASRAVDQPDLFGL